MIEIQKCIANKTETFFPQPSFFINRIFKPHKVTTRKNELKKWENTFFINLKHIQKTKQNMDTATAKRNALLQRRTPSGRNINNTRTTARVTRPTPVAAPPDDEQEELPQAFGKGIQNNENDKDSEEDENERNGESVDDEEDDPYSPLNGPSPSPAPPRYDDPQQLLRRNNNSNNNPKTAIRAGAIERPKSIAITHQQKLQQQKQPPPTSIASQPPPAPSGGSSSSYLDEYIFKVCVVGNHNVGKTSLVRRMSNPIIPSSSSADAEQILHTRPTIGVDFSSRVVENIRPGALVRMQLWDTAGLEKFAAVSAPVYRNCAGVIAVVDVLNKDTLDALVTKWLPAVLGQLPTLPLSSVLVLCNKMDLLEAFTTTANTDDATSKKNGHGVLPHGVDPSKFTNAGEVAQVLSNAGINDTLIMEVSAKSGLNVEDAISLLCNRIIDKIATTTTTTSATSDGGGGDLGAASGNRNGNGGDGDGAEAKSPGKPPPKSRKEEEVKKTSRGGGGGRNSDDDEDDDSASPRESNTDISNKYPTTTTKNTATGGGTGRSQIVNLQDAKKSEPLEASTSSSVRSKKSNATYCPC